MAQRRDAADLKFATLVENTVGSIPTMPTPILCFLPSSYQFVRDSCNKVVVGFQERCWFCFHLCDGLLKEWAAPAKYGSRKIHIDVP